MEDTNFHMFLNEEGDKNIVLGKLKHYVSCKDFRYSKCIKIVEVKNDIHKMRRVIMIGSREISVNF